MGRKSKQFFYLQIESGREKKMEDFYLFQMAVLHHSKAVLFFYICFYIFRDRFLNFLLKKLQQITT